MAAIDECSFEMYNVFLRYIDEEGLGIEDYEAITALLNFHKKMHARELGLAEVFPGIFIPFLSREEEEGGGEAAGRRPIARPEPTAGGEVVGE